MKKITVLLWFSFFLSETVTSQCVPDTTINEWGIYPSSDSLPCIERGVPYSAVLQFKAFDFAEFDSITSANGLAIMLDSIVVDSITNLPAGINYQLNKRTYLSNEIGCMDLYGVASAAPGLYTIGVYATMDAPLLGPMSINLVEMYSNYSGVFASMGGNNISPRFVNVISAGAPCIVPVEPKNLISGSVFYDFNNNGILDASDGYMANQPVLMSPLPITSYTNASGEYYLFVDSGNYTVTLHPPLYYALSTPASHSLVFNTNGQISAGNDFGIYPIFTIEDVMISITGTQARPGFVTTHWINYQNLGTTLLSGTISYNHDARLSFISSSVPPTSQNGNTITWSYSNLLPGEQRAIQVKLQIPVDNNLRGDTLHSFVGITPVEAEKTYGDNNDTTAQVVTGSYDPNDKLVHFGDNNELATDQQFTYTIRFQNTGNDTAFTVAIRDTIDPNLDPGTFKTVAASHEVSFQLEDGKYALWTFNNILLPDSGINEPASHGFVKFSILPKSTVANQTTIRNSASIYFDFNDPVKTNTTIAKVDFVSAIIESPSETNTTIVFPNPSRALFTISLSNKLENFDITLYDMLGNELDYIGNNSGEKVELNLSGFPEGIYFYKLTRLSKLMSTGKLVLIKN